MSKTNFIEIATERLLLAKLQKTDWEMVSFLRTDENVNKFIQRPTAETKEKALQFIERIHKNIENQDSYYWKITEKGNATMIGAISLWNFSKDRKAAEVGYDLSPKYQGKGIMSEALQNVIAFGFQNLNLDLIEAYTHYQNESSKTLLKRNGFRLVEGKKDADNTTNIVYELKK
ncbi:GNAT family N-acetyltransferase [Kordia sp. TARA_039_SRF]|nr:GNAT family N-acetyltransferase [Kordia sp. TARA_039_SRF]